MLHYVYMKQILKVIRANPYSFVWALIGSALFALFITLITVYPLLSDYNGSWQSFKMLDTWQSLFRYAYNGTSGGIINTINTILFGIWFWCVMLYRLLIAKSETKTETKLEKIGITGSFIASLGAGCAGCGITFLINLFGAGFASLLATLPFAGAEIGFLGTIMLCISLRSITKLIATTSPGTCPVL